MVQLLCGIIYRPIYIHILGNSSTNWKQYRDVLPSQFYNRKSVQQFAPKEPITKMLISWLLITQIDQGSA